MGLQVNEELLAVGEPAAAVIGAWKRKGERKCHTCASESGTRSRRLAFAVSVFFHSRAGGVTKGISSIHGKS